MNNQELELKIKEIIEKENFFDMIQSAVEFEVEYKKSDFYKATKMSLMSVIEKSKLFYSLNLKELFIKLQEQLNELDLSHAMDLIEGIGNTFEQENQDIREAANIMKELNA